MNWRYFWLMTVALFVTPTMGITVAQAFGQGMPQEKIAWEYPQPSFMAVSCPTLAPAVVLAPGPRAYRRGAFAAAAYIGPRAIYPGTLAPWGSIPPAFYAASYPLPLYVPTVVSPSLQMIEEPIAVEPMESVPGAEAELEGAKADSSSGPSVGNIRQSPTQPEAIPAPKPMDIPSEDETTPPAFPLKNGKASDSGNPDSQNPRPSGRPHS